MSEPPIKPRIYTNRLRLTRRKVLYFYKTRNLKCINCGVDLKDMYVVSAPSRKNRCFECAMSHHVISESDFPDGKIPDWIGDPNL